MRYILLIHTDESDFPDPGTPEFEAAMGEYAAFTRDARTAGVLAGGDELASSDTATCVSLRDGQTVLADGPFIETKEQLGGYFIVDVPNLDEAIKWAARIPGARYGTIEVRPIIEHET